MRIELSKTDLRWAHWRNIPPEPRPSSSSFSYDEALKKLQKLKQIRSNEHQINWHTLKLNIGMSREEAHFWIEAMFKGSGRGYSFNTKTVVDYINREGAVYDGKIGLQELLNSPLRPTGGYKTYFTGYHVIPMFVLFNLADFLAFFNEAVKLNYIDARPEEIFRLHILPYLNEEEKAAFRKAIAPYLAANDIKLSRSAGLLGLAALIGGLDAELENYLNRDFHYWGIYDYAYDRLAIFGLSSREKVEHYVRSKKLTLYGDDVQAWLAHTELGGLDWLAHSIADYRLETAKEKTFKIFKDLPYPEAVLPVLSLWEKDKKSSLALKWLVNHPELVAETLAPLLFTQHPQASLIETYLKRMYSMQQISVLEKSLQKLDEARQERFLTEVLETQQNDSQEKLKDNSPGWLREGVATVKDRKGLVDWVDILALPPLTVDTQPLNPQQIRAVLIALRLYEYESFIKALREHLLLEERENFVWTLFQSWKTAGAATSDFWVFDALAKLGGDGIVLKLIPLIERWPGRDHQNRNAKAAIDTLVKIGSDTAYIQLKKLTASKKLRSASIQQRLAQAMQDIARIRGLGQLELEDRLIPDCGLDKNGSRIFDFGSRQFTLSLSSDLKPMLHDAQGKVIKGFPTVLQSDNATLAAQAEADWNNIKAELKEIAKAQTNRLEAAMTWQRRWHPSDFQEFYLQHPVMIHLVRRLLWGSYDKAGKLIDVFRVDESGRWLNVRDFAISKGQIATVGIVHAAELSDKNKQAWAEILHDYEIMPPFPQLSYRVNGLGDGETELCEIQRFADYKIKRNVLDKILRAGGWYPNRLKDVLIYEKYQALSKITIVVHCLELSSPSFGYSHITTCFFIYNNDRSRLRFHSNEEKMKLGDVPPTLLSETLRILYAAASTAD